jgi:hypothetical protein
MAQPWMPLLRVTPPSRETPQDLEPVLMPKLRPGQGEYVCAECDATWITTIKPRVCRIPPPRAVWVCAICHFK